MEELFPILMTFRAELFPIQLDSVDQDEAIRNIQIDDDENPNAGAATMQAAIAPELKKRLAGLLVGHAGSRRQS